ncbi:MAG: TetR family transcriptional regulator [Microbacteriaceae bacterium]|nr:TetR family transcriptional regulator [Microbacteriaceae bacterium]
MSHGDITYTHPMSRWQPGTGGRIAEAAVSLFGERGFEGTTVADIAERAGVTRRTVFRYYPDKRDVIFGEYDGLRDLVGSAVALAPAGSSTPVVLGVALNAIADDVFAGAQQRVRVIRRIIAEDESLREREQHKNAVIASAGEDAFVARGLARTDARIAAGLGVLALSSALERWSEAPDGTSLGALVDEALATISALAVR